MSESFQEKYCRHFGVPANRYVDSVMARTLYWHARWLRWLGSYDYLETDRSFIASVGRLTQRRSFPEELAEYRSEADNSTFWRRRARLRVSSSRMQALFRTVWPSAE